MRTVFKRHKTILFDQGLCRVLSQISFERFGRQRLTGHRKKKMDRQPEKIQMDQQTAPGKDR